MVDITLKISNVTITEDGNYMVQLTQQPSGQNYVVKLTAAQCANLPTLQATVNTLAQPMKFIGQNITVTL